MNRVAITCSSLSIILMIHLKPSNWCCCCYLHSILLNVMHHIIIIIIILSFVRGYKACAKQVFSVMMPSFLPLHSSINFVKPMLVPISIKSKMIRRRNVQCKMKRFYVVPTSFQTFLFQFLYIKYWLHKDGFMFLVKFFSVQIFFCVDHYDWIIFHKSFTFLKVCNYTLCISKEIMYQILPLYWGINYQILLWNLIYLIFIDIPDNILINVNKRIMVALKTYHVFDNRGT